MLLNHMSTKVNGNTCFRLAGTQNTQFLTHWLLTTPSCMLRALHAPGRSSNPSLTIHCIYEQKSIRWPTSTAAPWVTCSSRKPHNDAIWEPGLLVQDAQPAYRLRKHLKGQGDWQWVSTHETDNLPRALRGQSSFYRSCHSIHSCDSSPQLWLRSFHSIGPPDWLSSSSLHSPHKRDLADYPLETERHIKIYSHSSTFTFLVSPATAI